MHIIAAMNALVQEYKENQRQPILAEVVRQISDNNPEELESDPEDCLEDSIERNLEANMEANPEANMVVKVYTKSG